MDHKDIVTRFAPSPTGFLHIGSVRTALFAFLYARKHNGTFILRIEDTDKNREVEGSYEHIVESLKWLGIEWDFGPDKVASFGSCVQSERLEIYLKYANILIEKGLAYADPYTVEEVESFRKSAQEQKKPFLFRDYRPESFSAWDGTKPLRLKVPEIKRYNWHDAVRGDLSAGEEMLDDFVIIKSDGFPTYNFAHIIDDFEMGVTHIMRADEFISSTPKFLSLYDALEIPYPVFVTLPPILRSDRTKKLGKRDGAQDILEYRDNGYLPVAIINLLALTGWNPGNDKEIFSVSELIESFDIDKIQKSGAVFSEEKLLWTNKKHLENLSESEFSDYLKPDESLDVFSNYDKEMFKRLLPSIRERIQIRKEFIEQVRAGEYDFAFIASTDFATDLLKWKNDESVKDALPRLKQALILLEKADFSSVENIKSAVWKYAEEVGKGELLWPLRVALSGRERSPDPFTIAFIIGRVETLDRIRLACDKIGE
ncbi:MAG: glutamate--tRNA ligase [Candidatus Pacebacteria bacterium]|nr:glutamate--tRNA ligase [Candidatus Paceibacterota bacterium]